MPDISEIAESEITKRAREIAKGLSEAQRDLLLRLPVPVALADWRVFPALKRRGLLVPGRGCLEATETGIQVRAHLQEKTR